MSTHNERVLFAHMFQSWEGMAGSDGRFTHWLCHHDMWEMIGYVSRNHDALTVAMAVKRERKTLD